MTKEAVNRGLGGKEYGLKKFEEIIGSRDAVEGAMAFLEKREPKWEQPAKENITGPYIWSLIKKIC